MGGLLVKHFGLLIAVLAAFPSLCCGQFTLVASIHSSHSAKADHGKQPIEKNVKQECGQHDYPRSDQPDHHSHQQGSTPAFALSQVKASGENRC